MSNEATFTKGPWYVDEYKDICANGETVAGIAVCENDADLTLMAAAPALYQQLYNEVRNCPVCRGDGHAVDLADYIFKGVDDKNDCRRCAGGRAALAKARGEA